MRRRRDFQRLSVKLSAAGDGGSYIRSSSESSAAGDGGSYIWIAQQHHFITLLRRREYRTGAANFHSCGAFFFSNGSFEGQNDDLLPQAGKKQRRPVGMVANLNRDNVARPERFQLMRKKLRSLLDSRKGAINSAIPV